MHADETNEGGSSSEPNHRVVKRARSPTRSPPKREPKRSCWASDLEGEGEEETERKSGKGYSLNQLTDENGHLLPPPELRLMKYTTKELEQRAGKHGSERCILDRKKFEQQFNPDSLNLSKAHRDIWDLNPHLRQVFANRREFHEETSEMSWSHRIGNIHSPTTPYMRRFGEAKTTEHWGQRKLLMSELEFLLLYARKDDVQQVVYAGAAPGKHTNYLSQLFPQLRFHLVDPARFSAKVCLPMSVLPLPGFGLK